MRAISSVPVTISDRDFQAVSLYLLQMTLAPRRKRTKEVDHLNVIHFFFLSIGNDSLEQESTVCTAGVNVAKVLSLEEYNMFFFYHKTRKIIALLIHINCMPLW